MTCCPKRFLFPAIAIIILATSFPVSAQPKWPTITSTTKPWTRWWWLGSAVNAKDVTSNLAQYKAAGLGGVEITPIYGVAGYESQFIDYLHPQWMKMLDHTLAEGKRLNLGVDMATGTGWPFGGGSAIGAADACRDFNVKTYSMKGGERLAETVIYQQEPMVRSVGNQIYELHGIYKTGETKGSISEPLLKEASRAPDISRLVEPIFDNKNLQALALDQVQFRKQLPLQTLMAYSDNGQVMDLTSQVDPAGKLNWTAPEGNWTLYALFMGWHGKMVERAAPGGEGNVIDHFSLAPLNKYLGTFDKAFAGRTLSGLRGFFNDSYEVDDARGESNWTPALLDEFKKRRGYDLRQHLPALLKKERDENSLRVLHDFRLTLSDLLLEKFTQPWQKWAKAKGKIERNQSHGSPANILDLYGAVDIPETEGVELLRFKFAASASHVLGKPLVAAEACTWLDEHFKSGLRDVKASIDKYFLGGVNHIVYHGTAYSPANETWPGLLFYASVHFQPTNPFWKDFSTLNHYVARCQSFLQSGTPDNQVLLYFPFADKISAPGGKEFLHHFDGMDGFDSTDFYQVAEEFTTKGVMFDFISDKQLQQVISLDRTLKAPGGYYRTIVVANAKYMPLETLEKLNAFAQKGVRIIFYKNLPVSVPGLTDLAKRQEKFNALAMSLKQSAILVQHMERMFTDSRYAIRKEPMYESGLQSISRNIKGGRYYFIVNTSGKAVSEYVRLQSRMDGAYIFDPMTGRSGLAKVKYSDHAYSVYLQLEPGQSCIVQTSNTPLAGTPYQYIDKKGETTALTGEWKLQFTAGGPALPAAVTLNQLASWTTLPGEAYQQFSGTALYNLNFAKPVNAMKADAYVLDLVKVEQSAEVWLNGKKLETLIGPVYQVTIPASRLLAQNQLQVYVSNGMANRIIYLEKQGAPYKKFYNVNFPARLAANRGANGLFTAINWQPEPSGLTSAVTLTPVTFMK